MLALALEPARDYDSSWEDGWRPAVLPSAVSDCLTYDVALTMGGRRLTPDDLQGGDGEPPVFPYGEALFHPQFTALLSNLIPDDGHVIVFKLGQPGEVIMEAERFAEHLTYGSRQIEHYLVHKEWWPGGAEDPVAFLCFPAGKELVAEVVSRFWFRNAGRLEGYVWPRYRLTRFAEIMRRADGPEQESALLDQALVAFAMGEEAVSLRVVTRRVSLRDLREMLALDAVNIELATVHPTSLPPEEIARRLREAKDLESLISACILAGQIPHPVVMEPLLEVIRSGQDGRLLLEAVLATRDLLWAHEGNPQITRRFPDGYRILWDVHAIPTFGQLDRIHHDLRGHLLSVLGRIDTPRLREDLEPLLASQSPVERLWAIEGMLWAARAHLSSREKLRILDRVSQEFAENSAAVIEYLFFDTDSPLSLGRPTWQEVTAADVLAWALRTITADDPYVDFEYYAAHAPSETIRQAVIRVSREGRDLPDE